MIKYSNLNDVRSNTACGFGDSDKMCILALSSLFSAWLTGSVKVKDDNFLALVIFVIIFFVFRVIVDPILSLALYTKLTELRAGGLPAIVLSNSVAAFYEAKCSIQGANGVRERPVVYPHSTFLNTASVW